MARLMPQALLPRGQAASCSRPPCALGASAEPGGWGHFLSLFSPVQRGDGLGGRGGRRAGAEANSHSEDRTVVGHEVTARRKPSALA